MIRSGDTGKHMSMGDKKNNNIENLFEPAGSKSQATIEPDIAKLTDDFRKQMNTGWSIPEAFLCLLISSAVSDGVLVKEELDEIQALAYRSRVLKALSPQQLAKANEEVRQRLNTRSNGLGEACEALPHEMRLSVFAHCVDIILSDRELRPSEEDFLKKLASMLSIPPADATWVMQVLLIKNRF